MMNKERFFAKPWPFNCEKSIAIAICGKCLVQTSNFTSMFSSRFPYQKTKFS
jgi:hypothetical protein